MTRAFLAEFDQSSLVVSAIINGSIPPPLPPSQLLIFRGETTFSRRLRESRFLHEVGQKVSVRLTADFCANLGNNFSSSSVREELGTYKSRLFKQLLI